jgi:hypothetical protein
MNFLSPPGKYWYIVLQITPWSLPSTSFPIHYSLYMSYLWLFIYFLWFNYMVSNSGCTALGGRMINEYSVVKSVAGSRCYQIRGRPTIHAFSWRDQKQQKTFIRIACHWTAIWKPGQPQYETRVIPRRLQHSLSVSLFSRQEWTWKNSEYVTIELGVGW